MWEINTFLSISRGRDRSGAGAEGKEVGPGLDAVAARPRSAGRAAAQSSAPGHSLRRLRRASVGEPQAAAAASCQPRTSGPGRSIYGNRSQKSGYQDGRMQH